MKRPSERTWQMLNEFYSNQGFWSSLVGRTPPIDFLNVLSASGEQLAVPQLAPLLVHKVDIVRAAAARCISNLCAGLRSADYPQFEQSCRNDWAFDSSALRPWRSLKPTELSTLLALPSSDVLLGLASLHNSWYVREAALEMLSRIRTGSELPFLLLRLNDWVPEIRRIAADAVFDRLSTGYAIHLVRHLWLVIRLRSCGRSEHKPVVSRITSLLRTPESSEALSQGISSPDRWTRRESFRLALHGPSVDQRKLIDLVIADADPVLRVWGTREVLPRAAPNELPRYLRTLSTDKFPPVRCEALNLWAGTFPDDALPRLNEAFFDSNASVRAVAQFWIRKLQPEMSLAQKYREALASGLKCHLRAAILGLGETGESQDSDRLSDYLETGTLPLRKAAIRSIAALNREKYAECFLRALNDEQPGVSSEAARALRPLARRFHDRLLPLFRESRLSHVRRNAFCLLQTLPFWTRGIFLFEAIRDSDARIVEHALNALRTWITKSGGMATPPAKGELTQLSNAVKASAGMLSDQQVQVLKFSFRTLG